MLLMAQSGLRTVVCMFQAFLQLLFVCINHLTVVQMMHHSSTCWLPTAEL